MFIVYEIINGIKHAIKVTDSELEARHICKTGGYEATPMGARFRLKYEAYA